MHAHAITQSVEKPSFALAMTLGWWSRVHPNLMQCFKDVCCRTAACQSNMLCLTQESSQPQRRQPPRRKAQQQFSLDSDSSEDNSPGEQEELSREEEAVPPEPIRRPRSARVYRITLLSMDSASVSIFVGLADACTRQSALERQDLSCTYLALHEPESLSFINTMIFKYP